VPTIQERGSILSKFSRLTTDDAGLSRPQWFFQDQPDPKAGHGAHSANLPHVQCIIDGESDQFFHPKIRLQEIAFVRNRVARWLSVRQRPVACPHHPSTVCRLPRGWL